MYSLFGLGFLGTFLILIVFLQLGSFCCSPENVLLTESRTSKLTDFGREVEVVPMISLEVIRDQPYNEETSIWSLGITIYELAMLKRPYVGTTRPVP